MKICTKCKESQLEINFSKNQSICKSCSSKRFKIWWELNKHQPKKELPLNKICMVCKIEYPISEFYIRRDRNKPISRCRSCNTLSSKHSRDKLSEEEKKRRTTNNRLWRNEQIRNGNLRVFLSSKICSYKNTAIKKGVPFNLSMEYLLKLFENQNGKCYYTSKQLEIKSNRGLGKRLINFKENHYQASLDRLIPSKGYIEGNVVWCGWLINTCKNMLSESEFYDVCNLILENKKLKT